MPSLHDTRLLSNLLKTEKDTMQASVSPPPPFSQPPRPIVHRLTPRLFTDPINRFRQYTNTAATAGSALSAWSVADSADTGDLMVSESRAGTHII